MTATVHALHPEHAASLAPDTPAGKLMHALESMAHSVINEQLRVMFESADDLLFEMAEAKTGPEQQTFLDTMRIVRMERPRILKSFQQGLHDAFARNGAEAVTAEVNLDDLENWSLQDSTDLEEKIAVSNMDSKAANLYANELLELEQRLTRLSDDTCGAVSSKALCPIRILEAFQQSMKGLDIEFPIKLVIYKLFDRVVVANMGRVFKDANQMLEANGVQPKVGKTPPKKKPEPAPGGFFGTQGAAAPGSGYNVASAMQPYMTAGDATASAMQAAGAAGHYIAGVNTGRLAEALAPQAQAAQPAGHGNAHGAPPAGYGNAQLATEMLSVIDAVGHGQPVNSWMPAQNLALVGRMFDDFYNDPRLPLAARPLLGQLQFPAMKVALADTGFFANPSHPVRSLVQDVFNMLTGVRDAHSADYHRLEQLVNDLLKRIDLDPARLRQSAKETHAVTEEQAEKFLTSQRERMEAQRKALMEKVRRIVAQELRLHIGERRRVPKGVMSLLLSGFAPLLTSAYMRGGEEDASWRETLRLLDRVLKGLDSSDAPVDERAAGHEKILSAVSHRLHGAGMADAKVQPLIDGLREVYAAARTVEVEPTADESPTKAPAAETVEVPQQAPATPIEPVRATAPETSMLLRTGEWFRVWDANHRYCHWLKLTSYHPVGDSVLFEDFGAENFLSMRATAFVHDLAAGRSAPVDPESSTQKLIKLLPPPPQDPIPQKAVWKQAAAAAS